MRNQSNSSLTPFAKALRRNMTKEERKLWYNFLKSLPVTVNRQKVIGNYIVDFCIYSAKLVIELDGDQHGEPEGQAKDTARDAWLSEQGFTVLRYPNYSIRTAFEEVCQDILVHLPGIRAPEIE